MKRPKNGRLTSENRRSRARSPKARVRGDVSFDEFRIIFCSTGRHETKVLRGVILVRRNNDVCQLANSLPMDGGMLINGRFRKGVIICTGFSVASSSLGGKCGSRVVTRGTFSCGTGPRCLPV